MKRYRAVFLISVIVWVLIFTSACGGKKEVSYPPLPEYNIHEVEPENNAAIPMTEALKLYKPDKEAEDELFAFYDGDKLWDKKFDKPLQRILEKNKQAFEKFDLAAGRPACVFPWKDNILEPSISNEFDYIKLRRLVQLQDMAAKREMFYGNYKKAIDIYKKIYRLGVLGREGSYSKINDMMSLYTSETATNGLAPMIFIENAPRDLIGETLESFEQQAPPPVRVIIKKGNCLEFDPMIRWCHGDRSL
ncbi:MAG: hypothetical protein M1269_03060 [Chloroflexi bacterium]|nr:hypothetical protein [Chloroflexota bacterium]